MKPPPRLYFSGPLSGGQTASLDPGQVHYLRDVMRMNAGDAVLLFNAESGEYLALVDFFKKDKGAVIVRELVRPAAPLPAVRLTLASALIKRDAMDWLVEKASELGIYDIQPLVTGRTQSGHTNIARLQTIAREAAEQCDRLDMARVHEPLSLARFLAGRSADDVLLFAAESGDAIPAIEAIQKTGKAGHVALLVGPEGGFTEEEHAMIRRQANVTALRLGPRLMRAETAGIALLSAWQAIQGDWKN